MKNILLLSIITFVSVHSYCQVIQDKIVGKWITMPKENMIIEVYKVNDQYKGKIAWVKEPNVNKPVGFEILDNLIYNPDTETFENGRIYDPKTGKVFNSSARLEDDTSLEVEGYWKFKFLGRTMKFKKVYLN